MAASTVCRSPSMWPRSTYNRDLVADPAVTLDDLRSQALAGVPVTLDSTFDRAYWGIGAFGGQLADEQGPLCPRPHCGHRLAELAAGEPRPEQSPVGAGDRRACNNSLPRVRSAYFLGYLANATDSAGAAGRQPSGRHRPARRTAGRRAAVDAGGQHRSEPCHRRRAERPGHPFSHLRHRRRRAAAAARHRPDRADQRGRQPDGAAHRQRLSGAGAERADLQQFAGAARRGQPIALTLQSGAQPRVRR
jgi:hypothetical protein